MRFKVFSVVVMAGLIVTACETAKEENASTEGSGTVAAPGTSGATADSTSASVTSSRLQQESDRRQASVEHFQSQVGDRVFFGFDRYDLSPEARDVLERQSDWLKRFPIVTITVAGHSDERGTREYNLALGERRANAVKDALIANGVGADQLETVSYGEERPAVQGSNEHAWGQNRRAVLVEM